MDRQPMSTFMLWFDFLMLGFVMFSAFFTQYSTAESNWYIWLLTYIVSDSLSWIQQSRNRPLSVEEYIFATKKPAPRSLYLLQKMNHLLTTISLIFVIVGIFTSSWMVWLGMICLIRLIVLILFMLIMNRTWEINRKGGL